MFAHVVKMEGALHRCTHLRRIRGQLQQTYSPCAPLRRDDYDLETRLQKSANKTNTVIAQTHALQESAHSPIASELSPGPSPSPSPKALMNTDLGGRSGEKVFRCGLSPSAPCCPAVPIHPDSSSALALLAMWMLDLVPLPAARRKFLLVN